MSAAREARELVLGGHFFFFSRLSRRFPVDKGLGRSGGSRALSSRMWNFAALNRWRITSWRWECSAGGQLSRAPAVRCSRRSSLGWRWSFFFSPRAFLSRSLFLLWSVFWKRTKSAPSSLSASRDICQILECCLFPLSQNSLLSTF